MTFSTSSTTSSPSVTARKCRSQNCSNVPASEYRSIRLAAVSFQGDKATWTVGPQNKPATLAYEKYKDSLWHRRFPGRKDAPAEYLTFPAVGDAFTLDPSANPMTATHPDSGAKWTLPS